MQDAICLNLTNGRGVTVPRTAATRARPAWMVAARGPLPEGPGERAIRLGLALIPWSALAGMFLFL